MKQVFHKIMSMVMVWVVLCSTLSFTVNKHYCGDTLVETALFHKAKGCGMDMGTPSGMTPKGCVITKKNCCDDKQFVIDGQDELQISWDTLSINQELFITAFVYAYSNLFEGVETNVSSYQDYKPPLVIRQLYKIDETYLI
ncbi:hypothetical protein N7U66_17450 [Lacinutrix neustonica]|uniref:Secreted protein n=1 Tax=Lacinutrix neustonica TaxID=2980107 RepID=A0A9E8MUG1_9FLAO|nr:hypothetical protein [Lacinutrix neustonica]WAC01688.1 hypothetical protein N7U66_17450 [Lacinutrix neustonica]